MQKVSRTYAVALAEQAKKQEDEIEKLTTQRTTKLRRSRCGSRIAISAASTSAKALSVVDRTWTIGGLSMQRWLRSPVTRVRWAQGVHGN
jgi:hypothetical protein